jgi:hypothetical protein
MIGFTDMPSAPSSSASAHTTMTPLKLDLDHLVVAARTLADGVDYIAQHLGVDIPPGGRHERMSTHNCVMQLGNGVYLEVIATDPHAPAPARPRWFDLDNPWLMDRLKEGPRLITWVVRTPKLAHLSGEGSTLWGEHVPMSRDTLNWLMTIPEDGRLPGAGFLPTIIEWQCELPVYRMANTGCVLSALTLHHHNADWLDARLGALGARKFVSVAHAEQGKSRIEASIQSPRGEVVLR